MKLFELIMDDGKDIFRGWVAAKTKKAAIDTINGNGSVEKITDVTKVYNIALSKLDTDLRLAGWGIGERELITALVHEHLVKNGME